MNIKQLNWIGRTGLVAIFVVVLGLLAFALSPSGTRALMESSALNAVEAIAGRASEKSAPPENVKRAPADHSSMRRGEAVERDGAAQTDEKSHAGGDEHEQSVALNAAQVKDLGIRTATANDGPIAIGIERLAEVKFDNNRVVHVVPRVSGIVREVNVSQGQNVSKNQTLATLDSRELAELKAAYLAAYARRDLARQTFERERRLWEKKVSSEREYLDAKTALVEADITLTVSAQKLRALGLSQRYVESLTDSKDTDLTSYEVRAPIAGTVTERHVSLGESISSDKNIFVVADTSAVWVDITIYPQDMLVVRAGQNVRIDTGENKPIEAKIAFVTPNVSEVTRTGVARVNIDNADGRVKPGMFIKARIETGQKQARIRIPTSAVQNFAKKSVVFVKEGGKFEPRPVQLGRNNSEFVEVVSGLSVGETYVAEGAFTVKSLIQKSQMGQGHGH